MIRVFPLQGRAILSTSTYVEWDGLRFLLDAGPGSVSEMLRRNLSPTKLRAVLISHSHIDHFWDLVPLLWIRRLWGQRRALRVICPRADLELFQWCAEVSGAPELAEICPIGPGEECALSSLTVRAFEVDHERGRMALGYAMEDPGKVRLRVEELRGKGIPESEWGKLARMERVSMGNGWADPRDFVYIKRTKLVYSGDTRRCDSLLEAARGADLLIAESTYLNESLRDLADQRGHMTVGDAVSIALEAGVGNLLLTHISMRHTEGEVREEATKIVPGSASLRVFIGGSEFEL
ncbi:MAG: MBL fold metallo-hydrolase [Candidatus Bathyarchaeia archaeon]